VSAPNILSREACEALTRRVLELVTEESAQIELFSTARSTTQFARGDTHLASQSETVTARLSVEVGGRHAQVTTNQLDEAGLRTLVAEAEALADADPTPEEWGVTPPQNYPKGPQIAFAATADAMAAEPQMVLVNRTADAAEAAGLIAAGEVYLEAVAQAVRTTQGLFAYERATYGQLSVTARNQDQSASGWAWSGYEDWGRVDTQDVITRAIDVARRSAHPVAAEPGRYTVILEPAAVAALLQPVCDWWHAYWAYHGVSVFAGQRTGSTKIGLQMMDRRLGMVSSPWDPERPASTIRRYVWLPIPEPVVWFDRGVLRTLEFDARHAKRYGHKEEYDPGGVRLTADGPPTSLEDMVASTKRGIWVNRLSHVSTLNVRTLLLTGTTRDGAFLIENGKITKPIKNLRFTESPFFVFNRLDAWGEPARAARDVVAPRLLLRDFNFTSLTDAL
jgi:predicted Zn-dependent protease